MLNQITYILLDAARMGPSIEDAKQLNPTFDSLYRGRSEESLAVVAPYLFLFQHSKEFVDWYMQNGWGNAWGILIKSSYPLAELHKHFRKFLIVGTEDHQELYFRFYDPRVLRIFLPTCDTGQLRDFFGPIDYFVMEDEDSNYAIQCRLQNGHLHSQKIELDRLVKNTPAASPAPMKNEPQPAPSPITRTTVDADPPPPVQKPQKPKWNMFD